MNGSQSKDLVRLTVKAADNITEIFVVDVSFQRIASGVGQLETDILPGIYKIRFRAGQNQVDKLIEVEPGIKSKNFKGPAVKFYTAAPIEDTEISCKDHLDAASKLSLPSAGIKRGKGSGLYIFIRDPGTDKAAKPWQGVSVYDIHGDLLALPDEGACDARAGFFSLNLEVDPGTYRLRVETDVFDIYEMFVVAVKGWQTQVFATVENLGVQEGGVRRASLPTASMFMVKLGQGFDPSSQDLRLVELVRLGLVSGRKVLTKSNAYKIIKDVPLNPMLGILGAHLLINQSRVDKILVHKIIKQLEEPFDSHPDVQALYLHQSCVEPGHEFPIFQNPPMLRSSWTIIVKFSRLNTNIVPLGSLTDSVADGLLYTVPWLIHRLCRPDKADKQKIEFSEAGRLFDKFLRQDSRPAEFEIKYKELLNASGLTPLEQNILNAAMQRPDESIIADKAQDHNGLPTIPQILRQIDAPNYAIARSVNSIVNKLDLNTAQEMQTKF